MFSDSTQHNTPESLHCHPRYWRHFHRRSGFFGEAEEMWGRHGRHFGRDFGGRPFGSGELRLVILQMIAEKPSYGYELIKTIEERLSGLYSPSAGVIYPTLTLLEEEGLATVVSAEGGKKLYAITEAGKEELRSNKSTVEAIFSRIHKIGAAFGRKRSPQMKRAMVNFMLALKLRFAQGDLTSEQAGRIVEIIDAAAREIESV